MLDLVVQFGLGGLREMVRQLLAQRQEIDWPQWRGETDAGVLARWETYWRDDTLPRAAERIVRLPAVATILAHPPRQSAVASGDVPAGRGAAEQLPALASERARGRAGATWRQSAKMPGCKAAAARRRGPARPSTRRFAPPPSSSAR